MIAAVVIALLAAAGARAEVMVGESLDWLVLSRPHVALAQVTAVESAPNALEGWTRQTVRFRITKSLKGEPPGEGSQESYVKGDEKGPAAAAEYLLFLDAEKHVKYAVSLAAPAVRRQDAAFSTDFRVLGDRKEIMGVVEKRLEQLRKDPPAKPLPDNAANVFTPPDRFLQLEVPHATAAHGVLCAGSACYLVVPADPQYKPDLLKQTRDPDVHQRARAARRLAAYAGAETVEALKPLLRDTASVEFQQTEVGLDGVKKERKVTVYLARQAAYDTLRRLGADVPKPEGYSEDYTTPAVGW